MRFYFSDGRQLVANIIEGTMGTFLELTKLRQSDRGYKDTAVETEKLEYCLEAARLAPSACNSQPWFFVVITDPSTRAFVANASYDAIMKGNKFIITAPVIIAVIEEHANLTARLGATIKQKPLASYDIGMATINFCLAAAEQSLGTCILGWFDEKKIKKALHVPHSKRIALLISLGYPQSSTNRVKTRKKENQLYSHNRYPKG